MLRAVPFTLPLPVPTLPTFEPMPLRASSSEAPPPMPPEMVANAKATLRTERAKLVQLSQYRMAIVSNGLVKGKVPYSLAQVNDMIADQRAIVETCEMQLREVLAAVRPGPLPAPLPAPEA